MERIYNGGFWEDGLYRIGARGQGGEERTVISLHHSRPFQALPTNLHIHLHLHLAVGFVESLSACICGS